jgi:hypothetical protein
MTFSQDVRGGTEPAGTTITVRVDEDGFHDTGGLGGSGQILEPLDVASVAQLLRSEFEPGALRTILANVRLLEEALQE